MIESPKQCPYCPAPANSKGKDHYPKCPYHLGQLPSTPEAIENAQSIHPSTQPRKS